MTCFGFLIVFHCAVQQPAVVSDFCKLAGPDVVRLLALSKEEVAALARPRKEAILALRLKYKRLC
jgi:hypothetical protein